MAIDLASLSPELRNVLIAAMDLDRANLENTVVHPCDTSRITVRRAHLYNEDRALSDALAAAGLVLPSEYYDTP